ncbi:T9SS type A sorting domain-containing protein [Tenacibaculum sp. nBUS_03]|uniref:T9SS type A sorting domain-containing protein n=1 Tax=Tenacibaculum sp. nBUS_03 TaxID=3395320 RepID=UPI003EC0EDC5
MMKKSLIIFFLGITITCFSQVSKNYKELSKKNHANYYEITSKARAEFKTKDLTILKNKKEKKRFDRWAYYWENRINPNGTFPNENTDYFNAGILDSQGKIINKKNTSLKSSTAQNWTNIGPEQSDINNNGYSNYPQMGRLNAFLRIKHPTDSNQDVLFVGAPNGGIWKSTDGGTNWSPKLDMVAGIGVTDIETVPGTTTANYTSQPIYVSTGDYDASHVKSIGVLKSTDGGETFSSTGLTSNLSNQATLGDLIVIDANTIFVGETYNIKKTTNGGTTWTNAFSPGYNATFGRAVRNGTEIMFTGIFGDVYYTSDYNTDSNWTTVVNAVSYNKAAVTTDQNGDFYIQVMDGQVKKFDKTNNTFSNIGNIPSEYNSQGGYNQALLVTNDIMITGEFNGQSSTNNGTSWTKSLNGYWSNAGDPGTYIHSDHHRMGKLDGALEFWSVNDGGLDYINYNTASNTKPTISYKSGKVKVTQSYSIAINPKANDGAAVMANQDNDAFSKKNGTWYAVAMGDGIQSAINYNNPDIRYAGNQNGYVVQTDTGFQGQLQGNGKFVQVPGASFYFPLEMHKTNPNILYGGGDEVYKLDASDGLTIATTNSGLTGTIKSIATHGNSVIASNNSNSIKFSSDQGGTWTSISPPIGQTNNITSVDYDASNNNIIYVSYSGYSAGNKVFKTTDGGANWTNISSNLPNIVVNEVLLKQGQSAEYLFAATALGVYFTQNGGTSWNRLGQGFPYVDVKDIEIHYTADKLVAGTFGRGMWEISVANNTLGTNDAVSLEDKFLFYPNPVKNNLFIKTADDNSYNYMIYNVVGGIVKEGKVNSTGIDLSDLAKNIYMVRVYNSKTSLTKKVIIE